MQMSVHISDVSVGSTQQYQRNAGLRDAEEFGYAGLRHGAADLAYGNDFLVVEHFLEESDAPVSNSVPLVSAVIHPFEVLGAAIRFNPVDVINHRQVCG